MYFLLFKGAKCISPLRDCNLISHTFEFNTLLYYIVKHYAYNQLQNYWHPYIKMNDWTHWVQRFLYTVLLWKRVNNKTIVSCSFLKSWFSHYQHGENNIWTTSWICNKAVVGSWTSAERFTLLYNLGLSELSSFSHTTCFQPRDWYSLLPSCQHCKKGANNFA